MPAIPQTTTTISPDTASVSVARTSDLLRGILTKNPDTKTFTIEMIMRSIGEDRFDANMIFISLPGLGQLPSAPAMTGVSAAVAAGQMAAGRKTLSLSPSLMKREIPRQSLAIAIHAALPVIEAAEKFARPRLRWLSHPVSRRILGGFLFILAAVVAFPLIGLDPLHSLSSFTISFGLAEGDGAAILLGVAVGVLSLAVIAATGFSVRALRSKAAGWLRNMARKLGGAALANFCEKRGLTTLAKILRFEWSDLLLMWNPERKSGAAARAVVEHTDSARRTPARRRPGRSTTGRKQTTEPMAA